MYLRSSNLSTRVNRFPAGIEHCGVSCFSFFFSFLFIHLPDCTKLIAKLLIKWREKENESEQHNQNSMLNGQQMWRMNISINDPTMWGWARFVSILLCLSSVWMQKQTCHANNIFIKSHQIRLLNNSNNFTQLDRCKGAKQKVIHSVHYVLCVYVFELLQIAKDMCKLDNHFQ